MDTLTAWVAVSACLLVQKIFGLTILSWTIVLLPITVPLASVAVVAAAFFTLVAIQDWRAQTATTNP